MSKEIISAIVALAVGIISSQMFHARAEQSANKVFDYIDLVLDDAIERKEYEGVVYSPEAALELPATEIREKKLQNVVKKAEELIPERKQIEILSGEMGGDRIRAERFVQKAGGGGDVEYVELLALADVDLSGATLGDKRRQPASGSELLLPQGLDLEFGDRIRIYTTRQPTSPIRTIELENGKGIWKGDDGEEDQVWLKSARGEPLINFEYRIASN